MHLTSRITISHSHGYELSDKIGFGGHLRKQMTKTCNCNVHYHILLMYD